jgi:hypothetical protein
VTTIEIVWIGEIKPDLFSFWIQVFLTYSQYRGFWAKLKLTWRLITRKEQVIPYSHNAIIFECELWHATTPNGVRNDDIEKEMQGAVIRATKKVNLNVNPDFFRGWLHGERGKAYASEQNIGALFPFLKKFIRNGDLSRNCSELVAKACQWSMYKFPEDCDYILPTDTFKVLKPNVCD